MKKRLGDILMEMGFIGKNQLNMALAESRETGHMLGDVLVKLNWVTEEQCQLAIAVQGGAKLLDPATVQIDQKLLAEIPPKFVLEHGIFPFALEGNIIKAATNNPFDALARDELARLTGYQVATYIAPKRWISQSIELYYETAQAIDNDIEKITRAGGVTGEEFKEHQIVTLADRLIEKGHVLGASDIHFVPDANLVRIYYRIDGVLHQHFLSQGQNSVSGLSSQRLLIQCHQ